MTPSGMNGCLAHAIPKFTEGPLRNLGSNILLPLRDRPQVFHTPGCAVRDRAREAPKKGGR